MATQRPVATVDAWTRWWNRISQVAGLAIMLYEVIAYGEHASFVVLLFASAMMLGGAGLRILVRGAFASLAEPVPPQPRDPDDDP